MSYRYVAITNSHSEGIETVAIFSLARKLFINNSTPHVFINVISPHQLLSQTMPFLKRSESTKKEQLIFTLVTIKVEVQLKKRVHAHALWSRTKFKTTKIFLACFQSFIQKFAPTKISRYTVPC